MHFPDHRKFRDVVFHDLYFPAKFPKFPKFPNFPAKIPFQSRQLVVSEARKMAEKQLNDAKAIAQEKCVLQ